MSDTEFDLDSTDALDEMTLVIRHPTTDAPTNWTWTFYGPGHPKTVELANTVSRAALRDIAEQKQARVNNRKYKAEEQSLDQIRSETVNNVIARTKTFTPVRKADGSQVEYSEDAARELLLDRRKSWLYKQVTEFLADDANFIQPSAKS